MHICFKIHLLLYLINLFNNKISHGFVNAETSDDFTNEPIVEGFDKDSLKKLTQYRHIHRKTVQGWLCAAAFVQNGVVYTDCTTHPAPNGEIGREWCYVEVQSIGKGPRDWDFCLGPVDYNIIRNKTSQLLSSRLDNIKYVTRRLLHYKRELETNINKYNNTCIESTDDDEERISTLESMLNVIKRQLSAFKDYKSYAKTFDQKYNEIATLTELTRNDYITDARNCTSVIGYDAKPHADGLIAEFYPNIFFKGDPLTIPFHDSIQVFWNNHLPVLVPFEEFSVIFKGYLEAPVTGLYTFIAESTLGVKLLIEDDLIINTFLSVHHQISEDATSKPIKLVGGKRYKIQFQSFNYAPLRYFNPYEFTLSLSWQIDDKPPEIIPRQMFYSSHGGKLPHVFGLEADKYGMGYMVNGSRPFLDSTEHYLSDIPGKYINTKFIKTKINPQVTRVRFYTTMDVVVMVALPINTGNLPVGYSASGSELGYFKSTGDSFSIYKSPDICEPAVEQIEMEIFHMDYPHGKIDLEVPKDTSFIIALVPITHRYSCDGRFKRLEVAYCTSSSMESLDFNCMHAFGFNFDELDSSKHQVKNDGWRAFSDLRSEEYLVVNFKQMVNIHNIHYHELKESQFKANKIKFLIGRKTFEFELDDGKWNFDVSPENVTNLKVILSDFEQTGVENKSSNIPSFGCRLAFYGVECGEVVNENPSLQVIFKGTHVPVIIPRLSVQDNGLVSTPISSHNGFYYGWTDRAIAVSRCSKNVQRHGGIQFGDSKWNLDVPINGVYKVEVELGSPCLKTKTSLIINDETMQESVLLSAGEYLTLHFYLTLDKTSRICLSSLDKETTIQRFKIELANSGVTIYSVGMEAPVKETKYCNVTFRYYTPIDPVLKKQIIPHTGTQKIEEKIERDINDAIHRIEKEDVVSLVIPRKENWDIKRDLTRKLSQLSYQTDTAILKLIRKGIEENVGKDSNSSKPEPTGLSGQKLLDEAERMAQIDMDFD